MNRARATCGVLAVTAMACCDRSKVAPAPVPPPPAPPVTPIVPQRPVCGATAVAAPVPDGRRLIAASQHAAGTALLVATDGAASWSALYRPFAGEVTELSPMLELVSARAVWMAGTTLAVGRGADGAARSYELAPRTTSWREAGDPGCTGALAALGGGRALVVGGGCAAMYVMGRGWQSVPARPAGAAEPAVLLTLRDQRALAVGPATAAHVFDPAAATWAELPPIPNARTTPTATLLNDGRVLVAGEVRVVDLLDPAAGRWSSQSVAGAERHDHAAVTLDDGRVLLLGGLLGDAADIPPTLVFDDGAWREAVPVAAVRAAATAFVLAEEPTMVALTAGRSIDDRTFELYDLGPSCATRAPGGAP